MPLQEGYLDRLTRGTNRILADRAKQAERPATTFTGDRELHRYEGLIKSKSSSSLGALHLCDKAFAEGGATELELFALLEADIELLVTHWDQDKHIAFDANDPVQLRQRLYAKAHEVQEMVRHGSNVLEAFKIQANAEGEKTGKFSPAFRFYQASNSFWSKLVLNLFNTMYVLSSFLQDDDSQAYLCLVLIIPFTLDTIAGGINEKMAYSKLNPARYPVKLLAVILWGLLLAELVHDPLRDDVYFGTIHNLLKPFTLIRGNPVLSVGFYIIFQCIWEAALIFAFMFSFISFTAILFNLLYYQLWDPLDGATVDSFFDAFVQSFIFLTSGKA